MAIDKVGSTRITDYEDETADDTLNAERCRLYYPLVRDSLLRSFSWNFAMKRVQLTRVGPTPVSGYDYAYTLPDDCLRMIAEIDEDTDEPLDADSYPWRVESGELLCNEEEPYIKYVYRNEDVEQYDPLFVQLLVYELAAELAPAIKQNERLTAELLQYIRLYLLPQARAIDAKESSTKQMQGKTLLKSRLISEL